jgi:hypothetical protein
MKWNLQIDPIMRKEWKYCALAVLVLAVLAPDASARKEKKKAYTHTVVEIPAVRKTVIPIETAHT